LRVKGKSMIEDLIDDGDIVVIRPQQTAQNGDIVVALLNNQGAQDSVATLKRFYRERNHVRLQPANATMDPILVDPTDLQVQGKVVAVMRTLF
jgi:repressor LexA